MPRHPLRSAALLATLVLLLPLPSSAQVSWASRIRLSLEPSAGLFRDTFAPDRNTGWVLGLRFAWEGPRLRLFQGIGWGRTGGVTPVDPTAPPDATVRNEWLLSTTGLDYPVHRGAVDVLARAGLGFAWVRPEAERGDPAIPVDGFQSRRHLLLGLVLEREASGSTRVRLSLTDRVYDVLGDRRHGPGVDLGVAIGLD